MLAPSGPPSSSEPVPSPPPSPGEEEEEEAAEEDLCLFSKEELVRRLRGEEAARVSALAQRGRLMAGVNAELQEQLLEVRRLKALHGRLQAENRELRELCLFLDRERLEAQRLARQWQLFGRHAARALRRLHAGPGLAKLAALEELQRGLARDNHGLRLRLCLGREEEEGEEEGEGLGPQLPAPGTRLLGDGSSSTGSLAASPEEGEQQQQQQSHRGGP